jgi:uncharacterized membrane protein
MTNTETRMTNGAGRCSLGVFVLLLTSGLVQLAVFYPLMPDTMASHFGADGRADDWMARRALFALLGGLYVAIAPLFLAVAYAVKRSPARLVSLPNKEYWTAPEREQQTSEWLYRHMLWFNCSLLVLSMAFHFLIFRANLRPDQSTGYWPWVVLGVYLIWLVGWVGRLIWRFAAVPRKGVHNITS